VSVVITFIEIILLNTPEAKLTRRRKFQTLLSWRLTTRLEATPYLATTYDVVLIFTEIPLMLSWTTIDTFENTADVDRGYWLSSAFSMEMLKLLKDSTHSFVIQTKSQNDGFTPHDDLDITIIWHNLYAPSSFTTLHKESWGQSNASWSILRKY
jgi:hypothetical protein